MSLIKFKLNNKGAEVATGKQHVNTANNIKYIPILAKYNI